MTEILSVITGSDIFYIVYQIKCSTFCCIITNINLTFKNLSINNKYRSVIIKTIFCKTMIFMIDIMS